jgi:ankyrin repeat protein
MEGKGLLNAATEYGVPKVFYRLLELGASVNAPEGYFSPLHSAAKFGRLEMCRELLNRGARVNALDSNNCNPLMLACRYGTFVCFVWFFFFLKTPHITS